MDMLAMPVRLVVKAPNQQIEDQTVECALDWTVQKLKAYLSEAYPSKPKAEEQKLIYSGQLLHDHLMLKDFLRQYEAETVHTVHLVCLPSRDAPVSLNSRFGARAKTPTVSVTSFSPSPTTPDSIQQDGARQRFNALPSNPQTSNSSANPNVYPVPNMVIPMPLDLRTQQMLWMQQMYSQYMNLYLQNYQGIPPVAAHTPSEPTVETTPVMEPAPPAAPQPNQNEGPERQPAPQNIRLNAQGGADDDDGDIADNRDWLDWFYILSRAIVLFSIVYFYSSFNRFALVMLFAALMYLFRKRANGFARARQNRAIVRPIVPQPAPERNDEQQEEAAENAEQEQMQRETREIEEMMNRDLDNADAQNVRGAASLVQVVWTIVATFFSSLLPEQHDPFNLN